MVLTDESTPSYKEPQAFLSPRRPSKALESLQRPPKASHWLTSLLSAGVGLPPVVSVAASLAYKASSSLQKPAKSLQKPQKAAKS